MTYTLWFSSELANDMTGTNESWGLNQGYIIVADDMGELHQVTTITPHIEPKNYQDYRHTYMYKMSAEKLNDVNVLVKANGEVNEVLAHRLGVPVDAEAIKKYVKRFYEPRWTPRPYKMKRDGGVKVKVTAEKTVLRPHARRH